LRLKRGRGALGGNLLQLVSLLYALALKAVGN
jgi:hypothetical protein